MGEISTAAVKSKIIAEGYRQSESGLTGTHQFGSYGTFVGIYDGHGGPQAAEFAKNNLYKIMKSSMSKVIEMSANVLDESLLQLDKEYHMQDKDESAARAESYCMVALIILGRIYIANTGDAKAVLGRLVRPKGHV
ncbi:probable protein phosphatase 2C 46 [Salvia splendens]|uniref:probable protein phosphatase 2C 46 n=1 Tax=Salvia splendens TaxID=180675 RepID=UPI00110020B5|nr:probable protein phosphatase 2C 46 [Salvia splendens]